MQIEFQHLQRDEKVEQLIQTATQMLSPHWRCVCPQLRILIVTRQFDEIAELHSEVSNLEKDPEFRDWYRAKSERKRFWRGRQVLAHTGKTDPVIVYVRLNYRSCWLNPEYYFQKEFFQVLARILWWRVPVIAEAACHNATGLAKGSADLIEIAFQDSFARFFLNPEYLKERKPDAWNFMCRIDREIQQTVKV